MSANKTEKAKVKTKAKKGKNLSPQQETFVNELPLSKTPTEAARKAGYSKPGVACQKLLKKPQIAEAVQEQRERIMQKYELTEERIIQELMAIAFTNADDVMTWTKDDVSFVPVDQVDEMAVRSIESISVSYSESGGSISMKRHDKVAALKMLGQLKGMWKDARRKDDPDARKNAMERLRGLVRKRQGG